LASACRGAAKAGAVDAVLKGMNKIGNPSVRDDVEEDAALSLQDVGQRPGALVVAKSIDNPSKRDRVLKKLASS
jgi:hypothetical protein